MPTSITMYQCYFNGIVQVLNKLSRHCTYITHVQIGEVLCVSDSLKAWGIPWPYIGLLDSLVVKCNVDVLFDPRVDGLPLHWGLAHHVKFW